MLLVAGLGGQAPPAFDVVSIKPNTSGSLRSNFNDAAGGHFVAENVSLGQLIRVAYGVRPAGQDYSDLTGTPSWFYSEHYDVRATAASQPSRAALFAMLRAVLADRFRLRTHTTAHEEPVFELQVDRPGRLGPGLKPAAKTCTGPGDGCSLGNAPGRIEATSVPMEGLAHMLTDWVDGHVEIRDRTGLTGAYAVTLTWDAAADPGRDRSANGGLQQDALPLATALRDQLGLKLVAAKANVPVLVVDSAERPAPD